MKKNDINYFPRTPLQTTVIGSYPLPGWLEFSAQNLDQFGPEDLAELQNDAVTTVVQDQLRAGLDTITDGEQSRLDFNLSFYGFLQGIKMESTTPRLFGPPAHDQRGKHQIVGQLSAPKGLGTLSDFKKLKQSVAHLDTPPILKASVPGPYTLSGRLLPNSDYIDRYAITEALIPIVQQEIVDLVNDGCQELTVDEPSMSCYAHREDPIRLVDIFNRTVAPVSGKVRLSIHLCFGNYKGRAVGLRQYKPMFPHFLDMDVNEVHLEMASREFSELDIISSIAKVKDVAVGIIDVKSYYIETVSDIADRVRRCLAYAPAEKLSFAPDCGLSQTARWAARKKLTNMVAGVDVVRRELGLC